ncbi:unnamed protein product, partial [Rotaria magnacalcarata]
MICQLKSVYYSQKFSTFYLTSGGNVQRELIQRIEYSSNKCTKLARGQENSILLLKSALDIENVVVSVLAH